MNMKASIPWKLQETSHVAVAAMFHLNSLALLLLLLLLLHAIAQQSPSPA
jgi:hypothetical protein